MQYIQFVVSCNIVEQTFEIKNKARTTLQKKEMKQVRNVYDVLTVFYTLRYNIKRIECDHIEGNAYSVLFCAIGLLGFK